MLAGALFFPFFFSFLFSPAPSSEIVPSVIVTAVKWKIETGRRSGRASFLLFFFFFRPFSATGVLNYSSLTAGKLRLALHSKAATAEQIPESRAAQCRFFFFSFFPPPLHRAGLPRSY